MLKKIFCFLFIIIILCFNINFVFADAYWEWNSEFKGKSADDIKGNRYFSMDILPNGNAVTSIGSMTFSTYDAMGQAISNREFNISLNVEQDTTQQLKWLYLKVSYPMLPSSTDKISLYTYPLVNEADGFGTITYNMSAELTADQIIVKIDDVFTKYIYLKDMQVDNLFSVGIKSFTGSNYSKGVVNGSLEAPAQYNPGYKFNITLPRDNFVQSQNNKVVIWAYGENIHYNGSSDEFKVSVSGYRSDRDKKLSTWSVVPNADGKTCSINCSFEGSIPFNVPTPLTVTIVDSKGLTYSDSVTVTAYEDFVDENNDGADDRSNQDQWTGSPDFDGTTSDVPSFPSGSLNPADYLEYFGEQFASITDSISNMFDNFSDFGAGFVKFFGDVFGFLPAEFITLIILGFAVVIILRILGR